MPAFTAHLNLYLPGGGSLGIGGDDEAADIDKINQDFQAIDAWAAATDTALGTLTPQLTRNQQFTGNAADKSAVTGMKRGDSYQEMDGSFLYFIYDGSNWKNRTRSRATLVSGTAAANGTVELSWAATSPGIVYQEGGKFWGGTTPDDPRDVLIPYAGRYRIYYSFRTTGVAPISVDVLRNGATSIGVDAAASGSGVVGAASHATRQFDIELLSTDKLRLRVISTAAASARGQITIEYLGEV